MDTEDVQLTRKQKKLLKKKKTPTTQTPPFKTKEIQPLTKNQHKTFQAYSQGKNLLLHGIAGTGKSFCALYLALSDIEHNQFFNHVMIVRSVVPTRDMGFLPGNQKEKAAVYEGPYHAMTAELYGRGDAYEVLKQKDILSFTTTSFIRGMTLNNCIVIVDEVQNMSGSEIDTVITRLGDNCRVIFCGDFRQTDLQKEHERKGLHQFMKILKSMKSFEFIDFQKEDIVRSELVKEYIIKKDQLGIEFI